MVAVKWLLVILGIGLFGSAGALVVYDVYVASQLRRLLERKSEEAGRVGATTFLPARPFGPVRWQRAAQLAVEWLSDKLQIMMVPVDGKNFFANDVFRSAFNGVPAGAGSADENAESDGPATGNLSAQKRNGRKP